MTERDAELYKKKIINVFKAFIKICDEYDLRYFCCGGTAIGAVRHQGMIPWDDDIDVLMPRADYQRFITLFPTLKIKGYELISAQNTKRYYLPYIKMCDANTTLLEDITIHCVIGGFVDIFPLDGTSSDKSEWEGLLLKYKREANKLFALARKWPFNLKVGVKQTLRFHLRTALNEFFYVLNKKDQLRKTLNKIESLSGRYDYNSADFVVNYGGMWGEREFADKKWFEGYCSMKFEGFSVRMPIGYHEYLTNIYGDYMQLPPENKRVSHHHMAYVNLDKRVSLENVLHQIGD
ncbi:LicD family protein [Sphingobacterium faecale]|uniref:LicD family protein n=1 Tax=Sphingobacterium faecale TaxID=2803775 RepID=A0ABS1QXV7_9SPHI|nr:LicD family protein [Sphingobacterium faecale]MBL1407269.1 LicD family protein [Sphingobacterium faecale]